MKVDTAIVPLAQAKSINGVRAVFGERYPDPVRVVAIGGTVAEMLADPSNARWRECSVEFCGGTHTRSSEEVQHFAILSEGGSLGERTAHRLLVAVQGRDGGPGAFARIPLGDGTELVNAVLGVTFTF